MKRKLLTKVFSTLLAGAIVISSVYPSVSCHGNNQIKVPADMVLTNQETFSLGSGVTEFQIETNNSAGTSPVKSYIAQIDLTKNCTILANYGKYYSSSDPDDWTVSSWSRSRTSSQANRYISATGGDVLVATNGDFYSMSNGKPKGALVINGTTYHEASGRPYFAMLDNGQAVIRDAGSTVTDDVIQAVGGSYMSVKDGQITAMAMGANVTLTPCNAIGIRGDGSVIIFMVDGRDDDVSVGYTLYDQARILISLGCVNALCLDCGGSSTFVSKHKDSENLVIQNNPSDGKERSVSSTLMIVKTDKSLIEPSPSSQPASSGNTVDNTFSDNNSSSDNKTENKKNEDPANNKSDSKTENTDNNKSNSTDNKTNISSDTTLKSSSVTDKQVITQAIFSSVKKFKYGKNIYRVISKKNKTAAFCGTAVKKAKKAFIPATIKYQGAIYTVTTIDKKACANNKKLKTIKLGKNITTIKYKAFYNCTSLKKVSGLKHLDNMKFKQFYNKYVLNK